jgi:hypothetical protein
MAAKLRASSLAICFIFTANCWLGSIAAQAADLPPGIYLRKLSGEGIKLPCVDRDGGEAILGARLSDQLGTASWKALRNDHSEFTLTLTGIELPATITETEQLAVVIDGVCLAVSRGQKPGGAFNGTLSGWIVGENAAIKLAKALNTELPRRKHPGHRYLVSWQPEKESYESGIPVSLRLTIENVGEHPLTFRVGGQNRGPRDNQFRFLAYRSMGQGMAIPDEGDPTNFGGIGSYETLRPGEKFHAKVALDRWFRFADPDHYRITGLFELELHERQPDGSVSNTIWQEFATGDCLVKIEPAKKAE